MSLELLLMDFICEISHPQQISRPNITLGSTHWFMISLFPRHGIELPLRNEPIDRLSSAMSWLRIVAIGALMRKQNMCEWNFVTTSQLRQYFVTMGVFSVSRPKPSPTPSTCTRLEPSSDLIQPYPHISFFLVRKVEGSCNKTSCVNKSLFVAILNMN